MLDLAPTSHARDRQRQRGISDRAVALVLTLGRTIARELHPGGVVRRVCLDPGRLSGRLRKRPEPAAYLGLVVVVDERKNRVITAYRAWEEDAPCRR